MVNAAPAEIALVPNTTFGISIVSEGLSWKSGDNVVIPAGEFPSNHYPWLHLADQGVELRVVPTGSDGSFSASDVERFCDSRTRVVAASWVGYASGYRIDPLEIASVAHAHGAFFFLDAIQGMGVFPLDVQDSGIDFFAADGHKWMMGPEGAGLFFCRETLLDELRPRVVGWNSVKSCYDFSTIDLTFKPTAARFEGGSQNMCGTLGLGASLDLLRQNGYSPQSNCIADRVISITDRLVQGLTGIGFECSSNRSPEHRSGIVSFTHPEADPAWLRSKLLDSNIVTSVRNNQLRFSPHAYVNEEDVKKAIEVLTDLVKQPN